MNERPQIDRDSRGFVRRVASALWGNRAPRPGASSDELRRRVERLRLSKMLGHLGARLDDYLANVPEHEIETHIASCWQCDNTATCDLCLRDGRVLFDMGFCPNYGSLIGHSKTIASRRQPPRWTRRWRMAR
jgi:hypothetical protein